MTMLCSFCSHVLSYADVVSTESCYDTTFMWQLPEDVHKVIEFWFIFRFVCPKCHGRVRKVSGYFDDTLFDEDSLEHIFIFTRNAQPDGRVGTMRNSHRISRVPRSF